MSKVLRRRSSFDGWEHIAPDKAETIAFAETRFKTSEGVPYDESYSYSGVYLMFYRLPGVSLAKIERAVKQAKHSRDLVGWDWIDCENLPDKS